MTPDPNAMTVREHHSLIELPPPGYKPRVYDPRARYFGSQYMDFADAGERADRQAIHLATSLE